MSRLTHAALLAAAGLSAIALTDAMTYAFTGHYSAFSDDAGVGPAWALSGVVHAAAYLLGAALLIGRGREIDGGSRVRRGIRLTLVVTLVSLALGVLGSTVVGLSTGAIWEPPVVVGLIVGLSFGLVFLATGALGFTLVRRPGWQIAALPMAAVLPLLGLTVLLGVLGSSFAHPAYAETAAALGVALVGRARPSGDPVGAESMERVTRIELA